MKFRRIDDSNDHSTWVTDSNNAFIRVRFADPAKKDDLDAVGLYIYARLGNFRYWCEDNQGFMYNFESLLDGTADAPAYMKRLAKRVARDLKDK